MHARYKALLPLVAAAATVLVLAGATVRLTQAAPWSYLSLSEYYAEPLSIVELVGHGFEPDESVTVWIGNTQRTVVADRSGTIAATFQPPVENAGATQRIVAQGATGSSGSATLGVEGYYPSVEPSRWYVLQGSTVSFTGRGFAPGEMVQVSRPGGASTRVTADTAGAIRTNLFPVSFQPGERTYTFTGLSSGASIPITITVAATRPYLLLSDYYAPTGQPIIVTGHQFGSHESVTITFDDSSSRTARTNAGGTFQITIPVPVGPGEATLRVTADSATTGAQATETFVRQGYGHE